MSNIKWKDEAVCFGNGKQWYFNDGGKHNRPLVSIVGNEFVSFDFIIGSDGFQLNEIRIGDYIEAPELETEQKYNDAVEVFELFGFTHGEGTTSQYSEVEGYGSLTICHDGIFATEVTPKWCARKLTYPQLMAIGKLKRAIIEKSAPKIAPDLTQDVEIKGDWSDEHYNHFHQLTEEDIKAGQIKVDAYFVNRMWKINSWEDTGAGFHILKTLPRIANNKNSLKRELVALKKQVDILCKLHGVDDE